MTPQDDATTSISATSRRQIGRTPVSIWAGLGALSVVLMVWVLGRWIADGGLRPAPDFGYTIPPARAALTWVLQALIVLAFIVISVKVYRECRRTGTITFNAALVVGWFLSCQWPICSPRGRPGVLPAGGHPDLPNGGQISPRRGWV